MMRPLGLIAALYWRAGHTAAEDPGRIQLELTPRVCTLAAADQQCNLSVTARWHSTQAESLCLIILDRPDVKRCWEQFSAGTYTVELQFADDLTFQLRDAELQRTLASRALRVIREVLRYRRQRREPWNVWF
jgi:Protein of unknown function (DUF3019)